jgi:thermitase
MSRLNHALLALALFVLTFASPSTLTYAAPLDGALPGEVLLKLQPGYRLLANGQVVAPTGTPQVLANRLSSAIADLRLQNAELLTGTTSTYHLTSRNGQSGRVLAAQLAGLPGVVYAEPNYERQLLRTPNDSIIGQQWALSNIQAYEAWDITTGAQIVVAVLDTGVDGGHPDLRGKVINGFNAIANNGDAGDDNGHGTAVAGLIAANTDNGSGIAGLCWGCVIMPIKVLTGRGSGSDAGVAAGIRWATDNGARILNLSLGGSSESQTLREAVEYAISRNVLVVAASGNERSEGNLPSYPAAYDGVLAVGATGNSDVVTGFSNTGDYVDMSAPGVGLWTTLPGGEYGPPNGTSFSSPYVAGAAALVYTLRPDLPQGDVQCVLKAGTDDKGAPGKDPEYGWGRLNAFKALQVAGGYNGCPLNNPPPPQPEQPTPPAPAPPTDGSAPPAFAPIPPFAGDANRAYFPETGHSLGGEFKRYWERHGGLAIFGFPTSEEFVEVGSNGQPYTVQYFERHRLEFHPEAAPPYNVQLSRIGDDVLRLTGRDWFGFPRTGPQPDCLFFDATGNAVCGSFLNYWRSNGLEFDGRGGKSYEESLALFGAPISPPQVEEVAPGVFLTVQWFERARFEDHGGGTVLLGLLSNEYTRLRGWR